jgi:hypothetical protein
MARLQLDLSETQDELITELIAVCDLRTKKDVVENALMLLGWAATEAQSGRVIAAIDEENKIYKEIQTPALMGARRIGLQRKVAQGAVAAAS